MVMVVVAGAAAVQVTIAVAMATDAHRACGFRYHDESCFTCCCCRHAARLAPSSPRITKTGCPYATSRIATRRTPRRVSGVNPLWINCTPTTRSPPRHRTFLENTLPHVRLLLNKITLYTYTSMMRSNQGHMFA